MARKSGRGSSAGQRAATSVDKAIGRQIRRRRRMLGLSQHELAKLTGVAQQQIQKYEVGTNRLSVSRLVEIADALEAPVGWFFRRTDEPGRNTRGPRNVIPASDTASLVLELFDPRHQTKLQAIKELISDIETSPISARKRRRSVG